jgi:hypothetical protein
MKFELNLHDYLDGIIIVESPFKLDF